MQEARDVKKKSQQNQLEASASYWLVGFVSRIVNPEARTSYTQLHQETKLLHPAITVGRVASGDSGPSALACP
jgi:hypothetical protein